MRNNRFDTLALMLEAAATGVKKTHLMYKANTSCSQNKKYRDYLIGLGLLKNDQEIYFTTVRGFEYLRKYRDLMRTLEVPSSPDIIFNIEIGEDGTMGADIVHPRLEKQLIEQNKLNGAEGIIAKVIPCG